MRMTTYRCAWAGAGLAAALLMGLVAVANAASVTLAAGDVTAGAGQEVLVPITAEGAQKMGALMADVTYDPLILEAREVDELQDADLAAGAAIEANVVEPGRWRVALARSEAIEGSGSLLRLRFQVIGQGQSPVAMENVRAWDQSVPPLDMLVKLQPGAVTVAAPAKSKGRAYGLIGAGVIGLVIIALIAARARKKTA